MKLGGRAGPRRHPRREAGALYVAVTTTSFHHTPVDRDVRVVPAIGPVDGPRPVATETLRSVSSTPAPGRRSTTP